MTPSSIPWTFGGDQADLVALRSLIPVVARIVDAIADGSTGSVSCECARTGSETFAGLRMEARLGSVGIQKPLTILIVCDPEAVGRIHAPSEDDPCGEAADARLMLDLLQSTVGASTTVLPQENVDADLLRIRVNEICDMPDRAVAMLVEHTPLGNGGLHVVAEDQARIDPLGSNPAFLRSAGSFDVSIRDDQRGTRIRIAPMERYVTVRRLDVFARLRLVADILERNTR